MTDEDKPTATSSQTVGPFFHFGLATDRTLGTIAAADVAGEHIRLRIRVVDGTGEAVPDALVELYQADAGGVYASQTPGQPSAFSGFGRLPTGDDGWCVFETDRPGPVAAGQAGFQAPHINVCLLARGLLRPIYTRIYFHGDAGHDRDPLLALVPPDRQHTLMATPVSERIEGDVTTWEIVIRMQGEEETVFFDL